MAILHEIDDACSNGRSIIINGDGQLHNFHKVADFDWIVTPIVQGIDYFVQTSETQQNADTTLELHQTCSSGSFAYEDNAFGNDATLKFNAAYTGNLYIKVANTNPQIYGAQTGYKLSVRTNIQTPLAVIIAGHDDLLTLQPNIEYSADLAYLTMLNSGIPKSRIRYLALNKNRDVDKNGLADDIYGLATLENVRDTIENWPITQNIGPGVPFFLYLVDHGHYDSLSNGISEQIKAVDLDLWLSNLEAKAQLDQVNVILEACKSGSFIDITTNGPNKISKVNRVIIASTSSVDNAYASQKGAYFSDAFWTALGQNKDMLVAYQSGLQTVQATSLQQHPWLDDNGDAVADSLDGSKARQRGLNAFFSDHAPMIISAKVQNGTNNVTLVVQARDDFDSPSVSVVIFKPSFREPLPTVTPTTPTLDVPIYNLNEGSGNTYTLTLSPL